VQARPELPAIKTNLPSPKKHTKKILTGLRTDAKKGSRGSDDISLVGAVWRHVDGAAMQQRQSALLDIYAVNAVPGFGWHRNDGWQHSY